MRKKRNVCTDCNHGKGFHKNNMCWGNVGKCPCKCFKSIHSPIPSVKDNQESSPSFPKTARRNPGFYLEVTA